METKSILRTSNYIFDNDLTYLTTMLFRSSSKIRHAISCYGKLVAMVANYTFITLSDILDDDLPLCFNTEHDTLQIMLKNHLCYKLLRKFCKHGNKLYL